MVVREKIWPKPDWVKILNSFDELDRVKYRPILYLFNKLYQAIPTKPNPNFANTDSHLKRYTDDVVAYRGYVLGVINDVAQMEVLWKDFIKPGQAWFDADRAGDTIASKQISNFRTPSRRIFQYDHSYGFSKAHRSMHWSVYGAYAAVEELQKGVWPNSQEDWQRRGFVVQRKDQLSYSTRVFMEWDVDKKDVDADKVDVIAQLGGFSTYLVGSFPTLKEAAACRIKTENMEWIVTHITSGINGRRQLRSYELCESEEHGIALARIAAKKKEVPEPVKPVVNESQESDTPWLRQGPTVREGDVTPKQLMDTFGFRGVNFGNWVSQAERQDFSNAAWDALHDLSRVLKLPQKTLSLNGLLGLAFGAQGGGSFAAAHFVPGVNEINLTKTQGAGCLAHEWAHALDHYYGIKAGLARVAGRPYVSWLSSTARPPGLKPDVQEQFRAVMNSIMFERVPGTPLSKNIKSELLMHCEQMDDKKPKKYWSTYHELFARSFEAWVNDKLAAEEGVNRFLVRVNSGDMAYPCGDERVLINKAFDALIETFKTENNAVLMSARTDAVEQPVNTVLGVQLAIEQKFGADALEHMKNLRIVFHADEITDLIVGSKDQALFDARTGTITLIASRITKGTECAVLLHELSHKNLEKAIGKSALKRLGEVVTNWRHCAHGTAEREVYEAANARAFASNNYSREFLAYAIEAAATICKKQPGVFATVERWLLSVQRVFTVAINKLLGTNAENCFKTRDLVAIANGAAKLEMQAPDNARSNVKNQLLPFPSVAKERIDGVLQHVPSTDPVIQSRYMTEAKALANLPSNEFALRQEVSDLTGEHIAVSGHYLGCTSQKLVARQWEIADPNKDAYSLTNLVVLRDALRDKRIENAPIIVAQAQVEVEVESDEITMGAF